MMDPYQISGVCACVQLEWTLFLPDEVPSYEVVGIAEITNALVHRYSVTENLSMSSKEDVVSELKYYREAGGNTICDVTPKVFR